MLALNGLDVLGADAHSEDNGVALAEFPVANSFGGPVNWDKVRADVELAVAGRLAVRARLAERARVYGRRRKVALTWAPFDRKVVTDNDASEAATVIEVRAPDAVGLLYRITSALAELDLDIRSAKVQTLGDHVVDAFYVRDLSGGKVEAPAPRRGRAGSAPRPARMSDYDFDLLAGGTARRGSLAAQQGDRTVPLQLVGTGSGRQPLTWSTTQQAASPVEERERGSRHRQVVQQREGVRVHITRFRPGRLRPLLGYPGPGFPLVGRGAARRVRHRARSEGQRGAERPGRLTPLQPSTGSPA